MKTYLRALVVFFAALSPLAADSIAAFERGLNELTNDQRELAQEYLSALPALAKENKFPEKEVLQQGEALLAMMPESDFETVTAAQLVKNHRLALKTRAQFPWGKEFSEELFVEQVLPYAVLDETREDWRERYYEICARLVKDCKTASEAAQVLNRDLFNEVEVHYNTGRKKPNQSPSESEALGKATCTGLSIILNYGCRAVGIPSRVVGTPLWTDKSGNHTWVEIWDGEWKFLGADEHDEKGLNRAWFTDRASQATEEHAIWATNWSERESHFPMVWDSDNKEIGAVNVTARYQKKDAGPSGIGVRVFMAESDKRVPAEVVLTDGEGAVLGKVTSKAGQADRNDVARLEFTGEGPWTLTARHGGREEVLPIAEKPTATIDISLAEDEALDVEKIVSEWKESERAEREKELEAKVISAGGRELKFLEKVYGDEPEDGHALWISMHGGGGTAPEVNDRQWKNQIDLYEPEEGYYVAPRAPTNTWNLWHQGHIDALFDRLIANYVVCRGVNPNRVYLVGYSAGGDGVYQLAPRMADRFAAASMMAGHPNETKPDGLYNLPFEIFMGEEDSAYDRNAIAAEWKESLAEYQEKNPEGYPHRVTIYPGLGHWMEGRDAEALPRMAEEVREEWPRKVVWLQDDVTHERFYWLGVKPEGARQGRKLVGEVRGQTIAITGDDVSGLRLWLSDELLDLDEKIVVTLNGEEAFAGKVERREEVVRESLEDRCGMIATARLELE